MGSIEDDMKWVNNEDMAITVAGLIKDLKITSMPGKLLGLGAGGGRCGIITRQ